MEFYELLRAIQSKPGLYLGKPSLTALYTFLAGYRFARRQLGVPPSEGEVHFQGFQPWVQNRFGITSSQSWADIILFYSTDEREGFERFFTLLEEFLKKNDS
jgi:hypothetical protein